MTQRACGTRRGDNYMFVHAIEIGDDGGVAVYSKSSPDWSSSSIHAAASRLTLWSNSVSPVASSSVFGSSNTRIRKSSLAVRYCETIVDEQAVHLGKHGASNKVCVNPATEPRI